jgi:hypothetical protein
MAATVTDGYDSFGCLESTTVEIHATGNRLSAAWSHKPGT